METIRHPNLIHQCVVLTKKPARNAGLNKACTDYNRCR